jgi:hypothetical protein
MPMVCYIPVTNEQTILLAETKIKKINMSSNLPNPFNPGTCISFYIPIMNP